MAGAALKLRRRQSRVNVSEGLGLDPHEQLSLVDQLPSRNVPKLTWGRFWHNMAAPIWSVSTENVTISRISVYY